jgi:hypothetical protein
MAFRIALLKEVEAGDGRLRCSLHLEYNQDQVLKRLKRTMDSLLIDKEKTTEAIHAALDGAWQEMCDEFHEQTIRMP